jgi:small-conductance mechanosensitive channel
MGPLKRAVESSTWDCNRTFVKSNGCSKTFETIPAMLPNVMSLAARMAAGAESFCAGAFGDVSIFIVEMENSRKTWDVLSQDVGLWWVVGAIALLLYLGPKWRSKIMHCHPNRRADTRRHRRRQLCRSRLLVVPIVHSSTLSTNVSQTIYLLLAFTPFIKALYLAS